MGLSMAAAASEARQQPAQPARPGPLSRPSARNRRQVPAQSSPQVLIAEQPDARETRERLQDVLETVSAIRARGVADRPDVALSRPTISSTYPVLCRVPRAAPARSRTTRDSFIGEWRVARSKHSNRVEAFREVDGMFESLTVVLIIATITVGIVFLVRTASSTAAGSAPCARRRSSTRS